MSKKFFYFLGFNDFLLEDESKKLFAYAAHLLNRLEQGEFGPPPDDKASLTAFSRYLIDDIPTIEELNIIYGQISNRRKRTYCDVPFMLATVPNPTFVDFDYFERIKAWGLLSSTGIALSITEEYARANPNKELNIEEIGNDENFASIVSGVRRIRMLLQPGYIWMFDALPAFEADVWTLEEKLESTRKSYTDEQQSRPVSHIHTLIKDYICHCHPESSKNKEKKTENRRSLRTISIPSSAGIGDDEYDYEELIPAPKKDILTVAEREVEGDQAIGSKYIRSILHEKKVRPKSIFLQVKQSKTITNRLAMREMRLPCDWGTLTSYEVEMVLNHCWAQALDSSLEDLFIVLMLLLGRNPARLIGAFQNSESGDGDIIGIHKGRASLYHKMNLPNPRVEGESSQLLLNPDNKLLLILPDDLIPHIEKINSQPKEVFENLPNQINKRLSSLNSKMGTRLSSARVSGDLNSRLRKRCNDTADIALICGHAPLQCVSLFYYSPKSAQLNTLHKQDNLRLFKRADIMPIYPADEFSDSRIGSKLFVREHLIEFLFKDQAQRIDQKRKHAKADITNFHNEFVLYTYQILTLATGHRPVRAPFQFRTDIDLDRKTIWISDKEVRSALAARTLVLSEVACEQICLYDQHLSVLHHLLSLENYRHIDFVGEALTGEAPYLFWLSKQKPKELSATILKPEMLVRWPIALNWQRHYLRNSLKARVVTGDQINVWLGHERFGEEAMGPWSGFSYADMQSTSKAVDLIFEEHKISAVSGFTLTQFAIPKVTAKKIVQTSQYGRDLNATKRSNRKRNIEKQVDLYLEVDLPGLFLTPIDCDKYELGIKSLLSKIEKEFSSAIDQNNARWYLARFIEQGNRSGKWALEPPETLVKLRRHRQMRTLKWNFTASHATRLAKDFEQALNNHALLDSSTREELLSLLLLTASLYGGLCQEEPLLQLIHEISKDAPLVRCNLGEQQLLWIDLIHEDRTIHNIRKENVPKRLTRWYVDTHSLGIIRRIQQCSSEKAVKKSSPTLFKTLKQILKKIGIAFPLTSIRALCRSAIAVTESQPSVKLSSAMAETLVGRNLSVSLPTEYWKEIISPSKFNDVELEFAKFFTKSPGLRQAQKGKQQRPADIAKILFSLNDALRIKDKKRHKRTSTQVLGCLEELDLSDWPYIAQYLTEWYVYLLTIRNFAVSSVRRYHDEVASSLLLIDMELDLCSLDGDDLYSVYERSINEPESNISRNFRAGRLQDFHHFLEQSHDFPFLERPISDTNKNIPMVRAGYITNGLYQHVLNCLKNLRDVSDETAKAFATLFILAYRTGLRLNELVKLRVSEVEPSMEFWVFIRSNLFGDNKRSSSLRKIPLDLLLTSEELAYCRLFISNRLRDSYNDNEAVFCMDGFGIVPFDSTMLSRFFGAVLKQASGIPTMTFHHLRHTAISNMHLIAEREWEAAAELSGYSLEQVENVFNGIIGNPEERLRVYWALACFAGHDSPNTTLQSYIHFVDLVSHLKIIRSSKRYNINQCRAISDLTSNRLSRIIKSQKEDAKDSLKLELTRPFTIDRLVHTEKLTKSKPVVIEWPEEVLQTSKHIVSLELAHKILSELQTGFSIPALVHKYNIEENELIRWVDNAGKIADLKTQKGHSRLTTRKSKQQLLVSIPARPKSVAEHQDSIEISKTLRSLSIDKGDEVDWAVEYYISHATQSTSGIHFVSKEALCRFLTVMSPDVVSLTRWRLMTKKPDVWTCAQGIELQKLPENSKGEYKTQSSSAYLYLKHPEEEKYLTDSNNYEKYSASTLRFAFHMAAIMSLK